MGPAAAAIPGAVAGLGGAFLQSRAANKAADNSWYFQNRALEFQNKQQQEDSRWKQMQWDRDQERYQADQQRLQSHQNMIRALMARYGGGHRNLGQLAAGH